jgi:hypothetical protein
MSEVIQSGVAFKPQKDAQALRVGIHVDNSLKLMLRIYASGLGFAPPPDCGLPPAAEYAN